MLRKPTRPTMVRMPRRAPASQLSPRPQRMELKPILRRPSLKQTVAPPIPARVQKRVHFAPGVKSFTAPSDLPRRIVVSSYAADSHSILRDILAEGGLDPESARSYNLHARSELPLSNVTKAEDWSHIPVVTREDRRRPPATHRFPGVKGHRFWKLRPGKYRLIASLQREVLLGVGGSVRRTSLPQGVAEPPTTTADTYLEIGVPGDGDGDRRKRVTAKWTVH